MPEPILNLIYQFPVAGLLLFVVWRFLVFIKERDKNWLDTVRNRDQQFVDELDKQRAQTADHQTRAMEALMQNTSALTKVVDVMERVDNQLRNDAFEREHTRRQNVGRG